MLRASQRRWCLNPVLKSVLPLHNNRPSFPKRAAFAGIRFIDRFEVERSLIRCQEVWNDLAGSTGTP